MKKIAIKFIKWLLAGDLSISERNELFTLILDKIDALPLHAILDTDEQGRFLLNGSFIDADQARVLHQHANIALDNKAEQVVEQQVMWVSIVNGLHNGDTPEKLYFYRAAIWWGQQRKRILELLAQRDSSSYS